MVYEGRFLILTWRFASLHRPAFPTLPPPPHRLIHRLLGHQLNSLTKFSEEGVGLVVFYSHQSINWLIDCFCLTNRISRILRLSPMVF